MQVNTDWVLCDFIIATGDGLVSDFDDECKVHTWFIVSRLSNKIPNEYLRFINCYGKANRKMDALEQWHMFEHWFFCQWTNRKLFRSPRGNIWNFSTWFCNKTTCLLRRGCFNKCLSVATPVEYYTSMIYIKKNKSQRY